MAKYPDPRSAALPALAAAQRVHGWCSPEAIEQAATVMRLTPAYLVGDRDVLRHVPHRAGGPPPRVRVHEHLVLAERRRRAVRAPPRGGRGQRAPPRPALRVPRRVRHRADGLGRRRLRRPARPRRRPEAPRRPRRRAPAAGRQAAAPPLQRGPGREHAGVPARPRQPADRRGRHGRRPEAAARLRPADARRRGPQRPARARSSSRPTRPRTRTPTHDPVPPLQGHRRAEPEHARGLRAARRLQLAAPGARDGARDGPRRAPGLRPARPRRRRLLDGQEGVLPARRARWTSTCAATRTSPSPARSRTASSCRRARTCSSRA